MADEGQQWSKIDREEIREMLVPGRRLDCGHACEVAALLREESAQSRAGRGVPLGRGAGVANRAADALERASSRRPEILARWKDALLDRMLDAEENKLRWNLALMIWRSPSERGGDRACRGGAANVAGRQEFHCEDQRHAWAGGA